MKWKKWLLRWDMSKLHFTAPFLEMEWQPNDYDRDAAWDLYVELLTCDAIQQHGPIEGNEELAIAGLLGLFEITREVMHRHGRNCTEFTKIAVVLLNQIVRPFTERWERLKIAGVFKNHDKCQRFRAEYEAVQMELRKFSRMLADMAEVEDLTSLTPLEQVS